MKSPSLLAVSTVESRQLLFYYSFYYLLLFLPFFLLSNECALVCSIAIVNFVPYLSYNIIIFTFIFSISGQVPLLLTNFGDTLINIQRIDLMDQ